MTSTEGGSFATSDTSSSTAVQSFESTGPMVFASLCRVTVGDRALSERVDDVTTLGRTLIDAFQGAGLAAAGKHFPGHGDTGVDSHHDLPICELPPDRLRAVELVPFRAAIAADVAVMLTCHVLFTEIDAEHPATLSPRIVQAILKDELGYQGAKDGSAEMNIWLHKEVMRQLAAHGGKVPANLTD